MVEKLPLGQLLETLSLPAIVCFGNPLLDIVVTLDGTEFLKKNSLKVDGQTVRSEHGIQHILNQLPPEPHQTISPGGCAQNTIRIMQWLFGGLDVRSIGIFCGGLGNDNRGVTLARLVLAENVHTKYAIHQNSPTGICISLISGSSRSLVANLGASAYYSLTDLRNSYLCLNGVKIIYIEGFFITHSLDVAKAVIELTENKDVIIAFNLSGEYIFEDYEDAICEMVGLSKIVFGNASEMIALAKSLDIKFHNVSDIPYLLNSLKRIAVAFPDEECPNNDWLSDDDIFVMTQGGSDPAIVVWGQGCSVQVQPEPPKLPIIDTTGAGDSLVAGFLIGVLAKWDPKSCLEYGCKVAAMMITRLGVTFPSDVPDDLM